MWTNKIFQDPSKSLLSNTPPRLHRNREGELLPAEPASFRSFYFPDLARSSPGGTEMPLSELRHVLSLCQCLFLLISAQDLIRSGRILSQFTEPGLELLINTVHLRIAGTFQRRSF